MTEAEHKTEFVRRKDTSYITLFIHHPQRMSYGVSVVIWDKIGCVIKNATLHIIHFWTGTIFIIISMDKIYFHQNGLEPTRHKSFDFIFEEEFNMDIPRIISHRMWSSLAFCEITTKLNITIAVNYRKTSSISRTKSPNLNVSCLVLQWSLPNRLKPGWEWRCSWSSADRRCSNYIWVINNFIAY